MVLHSIKYYLRKISLNPTSTTYTVSNLQNHFLNHPPKSKTLLSSTRYFAILANRLRHFRILANMRKSTQTLQIYRWVKSAEILLDSSVLNITIENHNKFKFYYPHFKCAVNVNWR